MLEAVLGDRVAERAPLEQPRDHLRRALADRVQIARGDHQQRHAIDAMVVEPVADQRAALERGRLDPVQRDARSCARSPAHDTPRSRPRAGSRPRPLVLSSICCSRRPGARAYAPRCARGRREARPERGARAAEASVRAPAARGECIRVGALSRPLTPSSINDSGPPSATATQAGRSPAPRGSPARRCRSRSETGRCRRWRTHAQLLAREPAEEARGSPRRSRRRSCSGPPPASSRRRRGSRRVRGEECVGQQIDALLTV